MVDGLEIDASTLWDLSTGGSRNADDPLTQLPPSCAGPSPAGVDEACDWMLRAIHGADAEQRMLFLVGGPGGGKSRAAARLVGGLEPLEDRDERLAYRTYRYKASGRALLLVNDATIEESSTSVAGRGVARDIDAAVERGEHLVMCVNRGVLIDEFDPRGGTTGSQIVRWLAGEQAGATDSEHLERSYLSQRRFGVTRGGQVEATVVYVDVCSLLEDRPTVGANDGVLSPQSYKLAVFGRGSRDATPAGALLRDVTDRFLWPNSLDEAVDPVQANLASLRTPEVREGLLSVLRASEIIAGQRFTYRELWGCVATAIAGNLPKQARPSEAETTLMGVLPEQNEFALPSFTELQILAEHRWFAAIFGGLNPDPAASRSDPVLRLTSGADPVFDASPSWSRRVLDAFSSTAVESSPLAEILTDMPAGAVQPFDESVDAAFVEYCRGASPRDRERAQAWYGRYLIRMFATARGTPAFKEVVEWYVRAHRQSSDVPDELAHRLRTLLSPRRYPQNQDSRPLVPVFASRTDPLLGFAADPSLVVRADLFQLTTAREGEDLWLRVREDGVLVGEVRLDFDLLREASTCVGDWLGMTESADVTGPRVERFRSRRLTSASRPQLAVAAGEDDFLVTIDRDA